jgi:hypothetical protein
MLSPERRLKIQELLEDRTPIREIVRRIQCGRNTVRRIRNGTPTAEQQKEWRCGGCGARYLPSQKECLVCRDRNAPRNNKAGDRRARTRRSP